MLSPARSVKFLLNEIVIYASRHRRIPKAAAVSLTILLRLRAIDTVGPVRRPRDKTPGIIETGRARPDMLFDNARSHIEFGDG
jgi:hypothetical protein